MNDWSAFFAGSLADWITAIGVIFTAYTGAVMMRNDRRKIRRSAPIIEIEALEEQKSNGWTTIRVSVRNTEEAKIRLTKIRTSRLFGAIDRCDSNEVDQYGQIALRDPSLETARRAIKVDRLVGGDSVAWLDYYTHRCPPSSIKLSWEWVDGRSER